MVFFNYATMQMAAKIVYYGPGLCGKTTNLHQIYSKTSPQSRGEMVSLETETDRTLFFDLLPLDVGVIGGFKTRLQLYTVPGQVFYNTTRKLVLKGVDGIVYVADSQRAMIEANLESLKNLQDNLAEIGVALDTLPLVLQYNKRDLPNVLSVEELNARLNKDGKLETHEASAVSGAGVFETLKGISKLTLKSLRKRMIGDDAGSRRMSPPRPAAPPLRPGTGPSAVAAAPEELDKDAAVPVSPALIASDEPAPAPLPRKSAAFAPPAGTESASEGAEFEEAEELEEVEEISEIAEASDGSSPFEEPPASPSAAMETASEELSPEALESAVEVDFEQSTTAEPIREGAVKHVKVRSNIDVLAELEKLRKGSTQRTPAGERKKSPLDDLLGASTNHRKEITRNLDVVLPKEQLARARSFKLSITFEDQASNSFHHVSDLPVDLQNLSDVEKLLLNLKIDFQGK